MDNDAPSNQVDSHFLYSLLLEIRNGLILGAPHSSGEATLKQLDEAISNILSGEQSADQAFAITVRQGKPRDESSMTLALAIHRARIENVKWSVIELCANEWLATMNKPTRSLSAFKKFHSANEERVRRWIDQEIFNHGMRTAGFDTEPKKTDAEYISDALVALEHSDLLKWD